MLLRHSQHSLQTPDVLEDVPNLELSRLYLTHVLSGLAKALQVLIKSCFRAEYF